MSYTWDFFTLSGSTTGAVKDCHRGPMTDIEIRLMQPYLTLSDLDTHRKLLLNYVVNSLAPAIRTRECVLRVINSELGPLAPAVYKDKDILQALICEKRRATAIESDLSTFALDFNAGATLLLNYGLSKEDEDLLQAALNSNSPISRVAGRCAVILIATIIEMGL